MGKKKHGAHHAFDAASSAASPKPPVSPKPSTEKKPALTTVPTHSLESRDIFLNESVSVKSAHSVILQLRALAQQSKEPITLWLNSPGGTVYDALAVFDTMRDVMRQGIIVKTVAYGTAASMASFLLSAGTPGHRTMLPSALDMTHQPSGGGFSKEDHLQHMSKFLSHTRHRMESHYAHFMGLDYNNEETSLLLKEYMSPDVYLNAYTAKRLGLIDNIALIGPDGKPDKSIKDEFLRRSVEIDIELNKREYDHIDTSRHSVDPARHVKRLIRHRDKVIKQHSAAAHPVPANDTGP